MQLLKTVPLLTVVLSLISGGCSESRIIRSDTPIKSSAVENTPRAETFRAIIAPPREKTDKTIEPQVAELSESKNKIDATIRIKNNISYVSVRPEPSLEQSPIAYLKRGDKAKKIFTRGKWTKIKVRRTNSNRVTGWINNSTIAGDQNKVVRKQKTIDSKPKKENNLVQKQLSPM
jgi:hypothetical protein